MAILPPLWLPDFKPGTRFTYEGTAYPIPFSREVPLAARGEFEITSIAEDDDGELWFDVYSLDDHEYLFVTGTLLMSDERPQFPSTLGCCP